MIEEDVQVYWPNASEIQQRAILVYHRAGYNIMPHLNDDGCVEMNRPDTLETIEWLSIDHKGNIRLI